MFIQVDPSFSHSQIQSILDDPKYSTIYFDHGEYRIESPFKIQRTVRVMGSTPYNTIIKNTGSGDGAIFIVQPSISKGTGDVSISDFFFASRDQASIRVMGSVERPIQNLRIESIICEQGGIHVENSQLFYFSKLQIVKGYGIMLDGSKGPILEGTISDFLIYGQARPGLEIRDSVDVVRIINGEVNEISSDTPAIYIWNQGKSSGKFCHFQHIYCTNNHQAWKFENTSEHRLYNCYAESGPSGRGYIGFEFKNCYRIYLNACRSGSHEVAGFRLQESTRFNFSDCEAWENKQGGFYFLNGCSYNIIQGCRAWSDGQQEWGVYFDGAGISHQGNLISNFISSDHPKNQNYGLGGVMKSIIRDCIDESNGTFKIRNDSL